MTAADTAAVDEIQNASLPHSAAGWAAVDYLALETWIASDEAGAVQGFLVSRQVADQEFELLNMAIAPSWRRRGCAKDLLRRVLELHRGSWFLEVRASNMAAQALYEQAGFKRCGRRREYYDSPMEDAIEMSKHS